MAMLLMGLALSLLGVAVSAAVFAAATREAPGPATRPAAPPLGVPNFFAEGATAIGPAIPIELLLQIQRHVQLERAAAEAFHAAPTRAALHRRTRSPLVGSRMAS